MKNMCPIASRHMREFLCDIDRSLSFFFFSYEDNLSVLVPQALLTDRCWYSFAWLVKNEDSYSWITVANILFPISIFGYP